MIRFTRMNPPYLANETALFDSTYAIKLATKGVAVLLEPPAGLDEHGKALKKPDLPVKKKVRRKAKPKVKAQAKPKTKPEVKAQAKPKAKAKAKAIAEALADFARVRAGGGKDD